MKLADIEIEDLVKELGAERSAWINVAAEEKREPTPTEMVTLCVLHALERVLRRIAAEADSRGDDSPGLPLRR